MLWKEDGPCNQANLDSNVGLATHGETLCGKQPMLSVSMSSSLKWACYSDDRVFVSVLISMDNISCVLSVMKIGIVKCQFPFLPPSKELILGSRVLAFIYYCPTVLRHCQVFGKTFQIVKKNHNLPPHLEEVSM